MRAAYLISLTALILALCSNCGGGAGVGPVILHSGAPRPSDEISVIQVVKTHPKRGHPTINIRKITQTGDSARVLFQAQQGSGWRVPDHFGGSLQEGPKTPRLGNVRDLPDHFEVLPGSYRIDFFYVPAVDRLGWTHKPTTENTIWLECRAGYVYLLKGGLREDGNGWVLTSTERSSGG